VNLKVGELGGEMDSKDFLAGAVRDGLLIDSLQRALFAMSLTNGSTIVIDGVSGTLHFEHEMERLERSLYLLGVDAGETLPIPVGGRDSVKKRADR
jgi:hypothetical protein